MKKMIVVAIMAMVVSVGSASAEDVITVTGAKARTDLVAKFLADKEGVLVTIQSGEEVMGTFKNRPWPGVNVSTGIPGEDGIFVPISDKALEEGLCSDQQKFLNSFFPAREMPVVVLKAKKKTAVIATNDDVIRICVAGTGCDERSFVGRVPQETLVATGDVVTDILEIHQRPNKKDKGTEFKVKRLRVMQDKVAYPMQWVSSGACVRAYQAEDFSSAHLQTLLLPGETLEQLVKDKKPFTNNGGSHNTIAVYLIKKGTIPVTAASNVTEPQSVVDKADDEQSSAKSRVFTLTLPVGNR